MNDDLFLKLMHEQSEPLLRFLRADIRATEAERDVVLERAERVKQDKPMSRKGDRT